MKISIMLAAAGLAVASMGVSTAAVAQNRNHDRDGYRDGHRDRGGYRDRRHYDRGRHNGYDRRHYGRRHYGWNRHCRTIWRYGHRVRVCR
ncbi:hypothetical protein NDN01_19240 [Sphingomonas sp. QA11]|uniref:hypothetical protein n=1 Tax=Sphingomonas sp. QA11 TaxID=2950605 RepID=UPI00234BA80B|nr:hypothetical protein [Sphingomonas sp. QA11]WCM26125.1 hypothetical protein NDN01_19240 [Sphingomonas sp. QA11]